ncbi:MAG: hypothetical protein D6675_11055 [Gemmatimonadetes bacterium]|nr:MAG: hypothetical protein D6675_11055 [Gemmatimonadota bacterium]
MKPVATIILAAGKGTRMKSDLPKVLIPVGGKPMIHHVLETVKQLQFQPVVIVVGYRAEVVQAEIAGVSATFVRQEPQNGTGHAVQQAEPVLRQFTGDTVVLYGDVPFIRPETLHRLVDVHQKENATATILTVDMPDPTRYGRIVRLPNGHVARIVEHADASPEELAITEINTGIICFRTPELFEALQHINAQNQQGEMYLTDTIEIFSRAGKSIRAVKIEDPFEVMGLDNRAKVQAAEAQLRARKVWKDTP